MSKVTKWAVETAMASMNETIQKKMVKWDKENPVKAKEITCQSMAEIAVKDPAWQAWVVGFAKNEYRDVSIRCSDFKSNSPLVADAIKKNCAVDATRNKAREEVNEALCEKRDKIIRAAIIGDCDGAELLKQVNEFCE